jgi:hypothetical protein
VRDVRFVQSKPGCEVPDRTSLWSGAVHALERLSPFDTRAIRTGDLLKLALSELKISTESALASARSKEDLRKAAEESLGGMVYVGRPDCVVALRRWFDTQQVDAFSADEFVDVPFNGRIIERAAIEAMRRSPHTLNKYDRPNHEEIMMAGYIVEFAVGHAIAERWPTVYLPPTNDGSYTDPAGDDFRLLAERMYLVDVSRMRRREGTYGGVKWKLPADLHILAERVGTSGVVRIFGYCTHEQFVKGGVTPQYALPFRALALKLNCEVDGVNYNKVMERALAPVAVKRYSKGQKTWNGDQLRLLG